MKIAVENGSFGYGKIPILSDIDLAVRENKVLTILGPNGVGKTTLFKCMMGFLKWKTGMTLLDGRPMKEYSHLEIWSKVSYVSQAKRNPFAYSILDTVVMGLNAEAGAFSCPSHADYERAWNQLEWMGITDIASRNCNEVSGGQLQMALIARVGKRAERADSRRARKQSGYAQPAARHRGDREDRPPEVDHLHHQHPFPRSCVHGVRRHLVLGEGRNAALRPDGRGSE